MTGADLRAAETWLEASGHKQPKPTALQLEFITSSQQRERENQRKELERQQQQLALERKARVSEQRARNRLRYLVAVLAVSLAVVGLIAFQLNQLLEFQRQFSVSVENFYTRAGEYLRNEDFGEAVAEYTRVLELNALNFDPAYIDAYHGLGQAHFYRKEYPAAIENYTDYLAEVPDDPSAYLDRAQAYIMQRDFAQAEGDYELASQIDESYQDTLTNFRGLLGQPRPIAASYSGFDSLINDFQFQRLLVDPERLPQSPNILAIRHSHSRTGAA